MGRERTIIGTLILLLAVLWVGFFVHRAPRFPGSLTGGILAVMGATLIVAFSFAYMAVKRVHRLSQTIGDRVSTGTLLKWHVYTSAVGAVLTLLHTGHLFESGLGIALTASMLITVLSGYVGRHLVGQVSLELREKRAQLETLETAYNEAVSEIVRAPNQKLDSGETARVFSWATLRAVFPDINLRQVSNGPSARAVKMAESIAELEYSIRNHERLQRLSARWLKVHIAVALVFYILLALHVWASIHFGLRWFQ
ncbi:MAG: hypothetical protein AB7I12_03605 [Steroidobacteraceae bacterium]